MASAAKAKTPAGRDSGYGRDFGQKRKKGGIRNDVKKEIEEKSKEKRKCYNCKVTQHLTRSCPKNYAEVVFL